jgi:hypothetical protein
LQRRKGRRREVEWNASKESIEKLKEKEEKVKRNGGGVWHLYEWGWGKRKKKKREMGEREEGSVRKGEEERWRGGGLVGTGKRDGGGVCVEI